MTRTTVGSLAAGTFALGLLVGLVIPGAFARVDHDRLMTDHMAAMGSMMNGSMGSMMGGRAMPMMPGLDVSAGHRAHHASPGVMP